MLEGAAAALFKVCLNSDPSSNMSRYCFGDAFRDNGHIRVPEPPDIMTGKILTISAPIPFTEIPLKENISSTYRNKQFTGPPIGRQMQFAALGSVA